jgi:hypothetical protein
MRAAGDVAMLTVDSAAADAVGDAGAVEACRGAEPVPQLAHPAAGLRALAAFSAQQCSSGAKESLRLLFVVQLARSCRPLVGSQRLMPRAVGVCVRVCACRRTGQKAKGRQRVGCCLRGVWVGLAACGLQRACRQTLTPQTVTSADTDATDCHTVLCFRVTMPGGGCISGTGGCQGHVESQVLVKPWYCSVRWQAWQLGPLPCCCDSQTVCLDGRRPCS